MAVLLLVTVFVGLIAPLQSRYAGGNEGDMAYVRIGCDPGYIVITRAQYFAPNGFFCSHLSAAKRVVQNKCNNKDFCQLATRAGPDFGNPCLGFDKQINVHYECHACSVGQYFSDTESKCALCPLGTYSESVMRPDKRCGPKFPLADGSPGQCDGNVNKYRCCSAQGYCGNSIQHCDCNECTNFSKSCKACPAGQSVRVGEGKNKDSCGTVAYKMYKNSTLRGYSSGNYKFDDLYVAQAECIKRNDCAGVTYETKSSKYTLRIGPTISKSDISNPETSWTPLDFYGKPCICSNINSDTWTVTDIVYDVATSQTTAMKPSIVGHKTINNGGSTAETQTMTVTEGRSVTTSFTNTAGASLTVGSTFSVGIPLIVGGEVSAEVSASYEFSYGSEKTVSKETSVEFSCNGAPFKTTVCKVILFKTKYDVPYTMTWTKTQEKVCKCEVKGVFKEVEGLQMKTDKKEYPLKKVFGF